MEEAKAALAACRAYAEEARKSRFPTPPVIEIQVRFPFQPFRSSKGLGDVGRVCVFWGGEGLKWTGGDGLTD